MLLQTAMTIEVKAHQKKRGGGGVPIVIEHSSSHQQMRITLFMFERGQQHGLVFKPSKNRRQKRSRP